MADAYQGSLTREVVFSHHDDDIIHSLTWLGDDDELIETPWMDAMVYEFKDYDKVIRLCEHVLRHGGELLNPVRIAKLKIAMVNAERRKPQPNMERIQKWMAEAGDVLDQMGNLDAPGLRRTAVLWHYNGALLCRHDGDFEGEAEHHREISKIAEDAFSRNNAAYMAEFAMRLHHAKEGTATDELCQAFKLVGDAYRATLDINVPREAQWIANDWAHRVTLVILFCEEYEAWLEEGFDALIRLLATGIPPSSGYAADIIIVMTLAKYGCFGMSLRLLERIAGDKDADDNWRMLAALYKAQITDGDDDCRAVVAMPGNGICHAARAVAERALVS